MLSLFRLMRPLFYNHTIDKFPSVVCFWFYLYTVRLLGNDLSGQHANKATLHHEEEPFKSMEEIEAHTLLPDEDDLFSGVIDELGLNTHASKGDELEDFDLFCSGGGMELEGDDQAFMGSRNSDLTGVLNGQGVSNGAILGEHPYGEHPSRTLFVRNINSNVEDSELKALFEVCVPFTFITLFLETLDKQIFLHLLL